MFEGGDVKSEIYGSEEEGRIDREEDNALHQLSAAEMDELRLMDAEVEKTDAVVSVVGAPQTMDEMGQNDAEARFGKYLAEKMRMVPKEKQFDAELAVLGALREFMPR